jgi:hypothetical protein
MLDDRTRRIQTALEGAGLKCLFNAPDAEDRARGLAEEFTEAEKFYNRRYDTNLHLLEKCEREPGKYLPFLQSIGLPLSRELRAIILRLAEGKEIRELKFNYTKGGDSELTVLLNEEHPEEPITAASPWDALLLPQLGYFVSDERLVFGGIRPWELPEEE